MIPGGEVGGPEILVVSPVREKPLESVEAPSSVDGALEVDNARGDDASWFRHLIVRQYNIRENVHRSIPQKSPYRQRAAWQRLHHYRSQKCGPSS